ncbi:MAG: hypothetical protein JRM97_08790 [Nitrososphaerota archaeon]|jgi:hypothetical protein|nr:hypothetical protein [Nitrososphaerota archaeon]MDG6899660.1 hypothetical protein [Nitrososphaerota archaeon]MDG6920661.1 hypothetical protein [Nitrososphaerota archaeon]MDG6924895.1 hypothetical protein [Nitrososphaerota archaeon]MDG7004243.1 hypothetical protein [Nitrososphaerota archaeon]
MALPFMGASIAFMLLALMAGIFRLMAQNGVGPVVLGNLFALHPLLMVFGFIAGMIVTERIAGVELLPHTKQTRLSLAIPPFIFVGMAVEMLGFLFDLALASYVGAALLVVASLLFLSLLRSFLTMGREKMSVLFMVVSGVALLLSALLSAFSLPAGNVGFVMTLLLFPVVFVLGERVELTSLATKSSSDRFVPALIMVAVALGLFGLDAWSLTSMTLVAFGLTGLTFGFFLVNERKARPNATALPFQKYVRNHVELAYVWGLAGSVFGVAYSLSPLFVFYDAFIHSLALGFIGLMFLAHGPIILPMVTRRQFDNAKLSSIPLAILMVALVTRIGSELALLYDGAWLLNLSVAVSGWLVLLAVAAFFVEILRGTRRSGAERHLGAVQAPK